MVGLLAVIAVLLVVIVVRLGGGELLPKVLIVGLLLGLVVQAIRWTDPDRVADDQSSDRGPN
ncbi:hypothetical protein [Halorussus ruber]|uniref:hypothetical protein n=1 Tax=Halorussus ruber TaxID=1126238 RepID=UPI001092C2B5|nr:hypothetical protein [Halorussus ruber]